MDQLLLDTAVQPKGLWNTHIDCLQVCADVASRDLDIVDIAGMTGLGFRTALCAQAIPPSTYLSWSFAQAFSAWLGMIGVEAEIGFHRIGIASYQGWAERYTATINESLTKGYPCIYWDNLGFGLVVGASEGQLELTGIPGKTVHPVWHDHPKTKEFSTRLVEYPLREDTRHSFSTNIEAIANKSVGDTVFVACPVGVCKFDPELSAQESLYYICAELNGRIEYPRMQDDGVNQFLPQFGIGAIERLRGELESKQVHDFGLIQFVQVAAEARGLGCRYLKRLVNNIEPQYRGRIEQATEFFQRTLVNWGNLKRMYDVPLDRTEQMRTGRLLEAREQLYQIKQTENTAARLLQGVASEIFEN